MLLTPLLTPKCDPKNPVLVIKQHAYRKMMRWCQLGVRDKLEVSGLGQIYRRKNLFVVYESYLIRPEAVSYASVDMDPMSIGELMQDFLTNGKSLKSLRFQWHTHADFGVGWSGTDDDTARNIFGTEASWTVNLVMNNKAHVLARIDYPKEQRSPCLHLPVFLGLPLLKRERIKTDQVYDRSKYKELGRSNIVEVPITSSAGIVGSH